MQNTDQTGDKWGNISDSLKVSIEKCLKDMEARIAELNEEMVKFYSKWLTKKYHLESSIQGSIFTFHTKI